MGHLIKFIKKNFNHNNLNFSLKNSSPQNIILIVVTVSIEQVGLVFIWSLCQFFHLPKTLFQSILMQSNTFIVLGPQTTISQSFY